MSKKDQGITTIKYGELHLFYPIRFEKNISIQELRNKIQESSIVFKEEYEKEMLNQLGSEMHRFTEEWNKVHGHFVQMRVVDYEKALDSDASLSDIRKNDLRIEAYEQDNKLCYRLVSEELEALQERCKQMQKEYEHSLEIYGSNFTDVQERFLLLPLKVTLYNQKQVWMYPFLYLFSNHMAILKLEIPLLDVSIDALKTYKINDYISGTTCTWKEGFENCNTIEGIQEFYKNEIFRCNIEFVATEDVFRHIILTDFENMPIRVNNLSNAIQEDVFRIVSAPAPNIPDSIRKDAEELLKNYSWGVHNIKCVLKSTGGCFSFIDKELLEYCSQMYLEKPLTSLLEIDRKYLVNKLVRDIELNVEFAILIIVLKKLNQHIDLWEKEHNEKDLTKIRKDYFENIIFISSLQECCYGSVSEQVRDFEKMLPHYMKTELMNEKLNAVERIRTIQENEKIDKLQQFIATGGFLLSVIFGLPSIYEALGILRECCYFVQGDVPIVSQLNLSVILWFGLNIWLCWNLFEEFRAFLRKIGNGIK